ncbi:MAG: type transport system permease protein [Frankiaceae bacterium]|jgi:ABC-2 type transport system permease protein|nr:type transport system permease protein [Frankiaceae bacterium]
MSEETLIAPIGVLAFRHASVLAGRCARISSRNLDAVIMSVMLPVMLLLMFVYLFGGALNTGGRYLTYVIPGVLLLCAGFGAATTAVTVSQDMTSGIMDRLRSMNVSAPAFLSGHVAASVARNAMATVCVSAVAVAIGFRTSSGAAQLLLAIGVLAAYVVAISWLAAAAGLLAKTPESANGFTFLFMFLPYASSAFVPISTMPTWLQGFARNQPVTPLVETMRGLLVGTPVGNAPVRGALWCVGLLIVSVAGSGVLFRRRTR